MTLPQIPTPASLGLPTKFKSFRKGQYEVAKRVADDSTHRFSLVSAPTGAGKSGIYATVSKLLPKGSRMLALVGTKGLQDQVYREFESMGMADVRGRDNYSCGTPGMTSCGDPYRMEEECLVSPPSCPRKIAFGVAAQALSVVGNYATWLAMEKHGNPSELGDLGLLVLDEAHTAEDWLQGVCEIELSRRDLDLVGATLGTLPKASSWGLIESLADWGKWAQKSLALVQAGLESKLPTQRKRLVSLKKSLVELSGLVREKLEPGNGWVIEEHEEKYSRGSDQKIIVSPVWPRMFAERYLFRGIGKILLTSATLSPSTPKYLGIPKSAYTLHEVESTFPVKRRPFYYIPSVRVDFRMGEGEIRILVNDIDRFIGPRLELGRKGLIHCRSFAHGAHLMRLSKHRSQMISHGPGEAREAVARYLQSKDPVILVSPSIEEGFDFPGDDARFQVIWKVPFVDTRGALMSARVAQDDRYRNYLTAKSVVQATGRIVRSEEDWGETAIFDCHWGWFHNSVAKEEFPMWFRRSWVDMGEGKFPPPIQIASPRRVRWLNSAQF